jgi:hypothetical protein
MRTFNGLQIFTEQLTNSGQLDLRYIIRNDVLGPSGQADFGTQSKVKTTSVGGVIAGGSANIVSGNYASIGGGQNNTADIYAFVGGGQYNQAIDNYTVIGGGSENIVGSCFALIGGGLRNFITIRPKTGPNRFSAPSDSSSIINGSYNIIDGGWSFIGGGVSNLITGADLLAFNNVLGGWCNSVCSSRLSTIIGGRMNSISGLIDEETDTYGDFIGGGCSNKAYYGFNFIGGGCENETEFASIILHGSKNKAINDSTIIGGNCNLAIQGSFIGLGIANVISGGEGGGDAYSSFIGHGNSNKIYGNNSFIGHGQDNIINAGPFSFIGNGMENNASGSFSFIGNGQYNKAYGDYSFVGGGSSNKVCANYGSILGGRCSTITANDIGSAILSDGQDRNHFSSGPHTLTLDFASGIFIKNKTILQKLYVPSTSTSPGTSGQFVLDGDYFYFCKKDNTWIRTALSSW